MWTAENWTTANKQVESREVDVKWASMSPQDQEETKAWNKGITSSLTFEKAAPGQSRQDVKDIRRARNLVRTPFYEEWINASANEGRGRDRNEHEQETPQGDSKRKTNKERCTVDEIGERFEQLEKQIRDDHSRTRGKPRSNPGERLSAAYRNFSSLAQRWKEPELKKKIQEKYGENSARGSMLMKACTVVLKEVIEEAHADSDEESQRIEQIEQRIRQLEDELERCSLEDHPDEARSSWSRLESGEWLSGWEENPTGSNQESSWSRRGSEQHWSEWGRAQWGQNQRRRGGQQESNYWSEQRHGNWAAESWSTNPSTSRRRGYGENPASEARKVSYDKNEGIETPEEAWLIPNLFVRPPIDMKENSMLHKLRKEDFSMLSNQSLRKGGKTRWQSARDERIARQRLRREERRRGPTFRK